MNTTNERFRMIIDEKKLSYKKISYILSVGLPTIRSWLSPPGSKNFRKMRESFIKLLEIKTRRIKK